MNIALLQRAILFALAFGLGIAFALLIHPARAEAKNFAQVVCDDEPDPVLCEQIHSWYSRVKSNRGTSCCGVADAYWADKTIKVTNLGVFLTITDRRDCEYAGIDPSPPRLEEDAEGDYVPVLPNDQPCIRNRVLRDGQAVFIPNEALDHYLVFCDTGRCRQGNPTGHFVVFLVGNGSSVYLDDGVLYPSVLCAFPDISG